MFDTNLVVVGNVLTAPEWRRLASTGSLVANFRIASTSRRFDRETGRWVDGNSFRVRVTAWRRLAEGVASSIAVGDPVVVYGRLYSRDWKDEQDNNRISYEMEAFSIGHDLARGRSRFYRTKSAQVSEVRGAETESFVRGETSVLLGAGEAPIGYGDGLPEPMSEEEPTFLEPVTASDSPASDSPASDSPASDSPASDSPASDSPASDDDASADSEKEEGADDLTLEVERLVATQPGAARRSRRKREPIPA